MSDNRNSETARAISSGHGSVNDVCGLQVAAIHFLLGNTCDRICPSGAAYIKHEQLSIIRLATNRVQEHGIHRGGAISNGSIVINIQYASECNRQVKYTN